MTEYLEIGEMVHFEDEDRFRTVLESLSDILQTGFAYWLSRNRPGGLLPRRQDINPFDITRTMPNMVLLDVLNDPRDYRYRVVGTGIVEHWTRDLTGQCISEIDTQGVGGSVWDSCQRVVETGQPMIGKIPYIGPHSDYLFGEDMFLPLVDDAERVKKIWVFIAYINR